MRAIHRGKLYDTDSAELVHAHTFYHPEVKPDPFMGGTYVPPGDRTQTLYLSPNGTFFYVYEGPGWRDLSVLDETDLVYGDGGSRWMGSEHEPDDVDRAIYWLEGHGGSEVILERWPERVWAG